MTEATPLASEQITQEDREAAAAVIPAEHPYTRLRILDGVMDHHHVVQDAARHRIAALFASPVPVGWKLVPITPTQEMFDANMRFGQVMPGQALTMDGVRRFWRMMLDSAPASPAPSGQAVSGEAGNQFAGAGNMVALRNQLANEAKDWRHNAYTRVMLAQMHDTLAALTAPAPSCAPGEVERRVKDILRGPDGEEYTDAGMEDAFFRWPVVSRAILAALSPQGLDAKEGGE